MKKFFSIVLAFMFLTTMVTPLYAAGWEKFKGGVERVVKSPIQVKDNVVSEYEAAEFKPFGVFGGALKGLIYTGKEIIHGFVDIVTFPVDL